MSHPALSPTPLARDAMAALDDLTRWRRSAALGQAVILPPAVAAALLDLAIAAIVVHQLVPNPQLAKPDTAVREALAANRATQHWVHARTLFGGRPHA
ncbi:hypothetical protein [Gemmatimonas sp.]